VLFEIFSYIVELLNRQQRILKKRSGIAFDGLGREGNFLSRMDLIAWRISSSVGSELASNHFFTSG